MPVITLYSPSVSLPQSSHLATLAEGVCISPQANGDLHVSWPDVTLRVRPEPPSELAEMIEGLEEEARDRSKAHSECALSMRAAWDIAFEPLYDPQQFPHALNWLLALTKAMDGWLDLAGDIVNSEGESVMELPIAPLTPKRVAARALVLLALSYRGLLEQDAHTPHKPRAETLRHKLQQWVKSVEPVASELEAYEARILALPIGKGRAQDITHAIWRAEGAQVLLWALGARELPSLEAQEHPYEVAKDCEIMGSPSPKLLEVPALRPKAELQWMQQRLLALHWRAVEFRVRGSHLDFVAIVQNQNFLQGADLSGVALSEGDISVKGKPLAKAGAASGQWFESITRERHQAINWLLGAWDTYSEVDVST